MNSINEWKAKGKFFEGTHYLFNGNEQAKEHVVCVHGIDSYHYSFDQLAQYLVDKGFRVLTYDLIGRGFSSPHQTGQYGEEEHIDQLHRLLEHLHIGVTPYHLIGLSMGGALSTLYAARYTHEIKSLTLLAPAGLMNLPEVQWLKILTCFHGVVRWMLEYTGTRLEYQNGFYNRNIEHFKQLEAQAFRKKLLAIQNNPHQRNSAWQSILQFPLTNIGERIVKVANTVGLNVHVIWGDKDVVVPYEYNMRQWRGILDRGTCLPKYTIVPNAGHVILLEFPAESMELIGNYLTDISLASDGDQALQARSE
jgi:pimeloyl-ACP methyl ester carboxylesterase